MSAVQWVLEIVDQASSKARAIAASLEEVKGGSAKSTAALASFGNAAKSKILGIGDVVGSTARAIGSLGDTLTGAMSKALDVGKIVVDAVEFKRTTIASLKYLEGTQGAAESTFDQLRKMATAGGLPIEQVAAFYRDLRKVGYSAREVQNIIAGGADASVIFGDPKAGEELLKAIQKVKITGKAEVAEFGKAFPLSELKKNLSEAQGLSDEAFAQLLSSGAIQRDRLVSAMLTTVQKIGGGGALGAVALKDAGESVTKQLQTLKDRALGLLADTAVTGPLLDALKNLGTFFDANTVQGRKLRDTLSSAFREIGRWIASISLDDMIEAFRTVYTVGAAIWEVVSGAWSGFSEAISGVVAAFRQLIATLGLGDVTSASNVWKTLGQTLGWIVGRVGAVFGTMIQLVDWAIRAGVAIYDGVGGAVRALGEWLSDLGSGIARISSMLEGFATHVASSIAETIGKVGEAIASWLSGAWQAGVDFVTGLWEGIKSKWGELKDWVSSSAKGVVDTFKDVLKIKSPSQVMAEIGENTMAGFGIGIEDGAANTNEIAAEASRDIVGAASGNGGARGASGRGGGVVVNVTINIEGGGEDAEGTAGRIADALRPQLLAILDEMDLGAA